jgi:hypothetical protein
MFKYLVVLTWLTATCSGLADDGLKGETVTAKGYKRDIVDSHRQIYDMSCIPMSIEMVLKLLGQVPASYYDLQKEWQNKADGNFSNFDGRTFGNITFHKQFGLDRNNQFPLQKLFSAIEDELKAGRFVIISLVSGGGWHMHVIYQQEANGDFVAVSKSGKTTTETHGIKSIVKQMNGTDILTYAVQQ